MKYPGSRWAIGRETLKRLKETTLVSFFKALREWKFVNRIHYKYNKVDGIFTFWNGSEVLIKELKFKPSDPEFDDLGSLEITGAFIDEVNQINYRGYEVLRSRCGRWRNDEYGIKPQILMSCNPAKNWVKSEFQKPWKEGRLPPHQAFVQSLVIHNRRFISKHYIDNLDRIKDPAIRARLRDGDWDYDEDPAAWFDYDTIIDLFTNKAEKTKPKYGTGDVARKGRDAMPLGYWEGLQLKEICFVPKNIKADHRKATAFVAEFFDKRGVRRSHVILDEDGVGGGIVDFLGCKGFINGSSPIIPTGEKEPPNFKNLKSQCYWELSELAREGKVGIEIEDPSIRDLLVQELQQIKQKDIDKDGKIACSPKEKIKEDIGRSPDIADMVMMRMYYEIKSMPAFSPIVIT